MSNKRFPIIIFTSIMIFFNLVSCLGKQTAAAQLNSKNEVTPTNLPKLDAEKSQTTYYLPQLLNGYFVRRTEDQRAYMPYFTDQINFDETAVFWFGNVNLTDNYADVRVGYTNSELFVHVAIFDRQVWFNDSAPSGNLEDWDAVTVYVDTGGNAGSAPSGTAYRFAAQVRPAWKNGEDYQSAYRGDGSGWVHSDLSFSTETGYRGNPNDLERDSGWRVTYRIPFASLGLGGPPLISTIWGLGVSIHDRDDSSGIPIDVQTWPTGINSSASRTWGQLVFELLEQNPVQLKSLGSVTIQQGLNGANVVDGEVGGHSNCGKGLDRFSEWGDENYADHPQVDRINIQNQYDVADFPCFSKFFITFPLDQVPAGKVISSAQLTMYQFGNAGGGEWGSAPGSTIQVFTISEAWQEDQITWNNAPQAVENVSQAWVPWLASYPGPEGIPRKWDVTAAVTEAYNSGKPVQLALYSGDSSRHSGKYFWSSDYNLQTSRPSLEVTWIEP